MAQTLLEENREQLLIWPAAVSYHHAERAGLLHHTVTMLRAAKALLPIYPYVDRELVLCGVIAHDLCKIQEINAGPMGIATEYTPAGMLLGHLVLGVSNIARLAASLGLDEETSLLLQHMVLSHHDTPEYGSPRPPMFPEAEFLHHLDVLDARMVEMETALRSTAGPGSSPTGARLGKPPPVQVQGSGGLIFLSLQRPTSPAAKAGFFYPAPRALRQSGAAWARTTTRTSRGRRRCKSPPTSRAWHT